MKKGPLDGIRVLGFTHFAQAPFALQLLGDYGADVINIERPVTGEFERDCMVEPDKLGGESSYFLSMNRNKRSMTLNLKSEKAKEIVKRLIRRSDVVVTNFRPGVLDKLGFGFEEQKKLNPGIIYAQALGYGTTGPYSKYPGQDLLAQCLSGYVTIVGPAGPPVPGGTYLVDMYSAMVLAGSICAALVAKQNGAEAQQIEVNLLDSALHLQSQELTYYLNTGNMPRRNRNYSGHVHAEAPYGIYETKDGYMALSTMDYSRAGQLGEIVGIPNLPELMPSKQIMMENREEIYDILSRVIKERTTQAWLDFLRPFDFWCARVNQYSELENDPQIIHNGVIREVDHPTAGRVKLVAPPVKFSGTPVEIRSVPPTLGQHNDEILKEVGYSDGEVQEIKDMGIL